MGVFLPKLELHEGETVIWRAWANHARGAVGVGGVLAATDAELLFQPNRAERWLRRKPWRYPRGSVVGVEAVDRKRTAVFAGGFRRRLAIRTTTGVEIFAVSHLDRRVAELQDVLS